MIASHRPDPPILLAAVGAALIVSAIGWVLERAWVGIAAVALAAAGVVVLLDAVSLRVLPSAGNTRAAPPPRDFDPPDGHPVAAGDERVDGGAGPVDGAADATAPDEATAAPEEPAHGVVSADAEVEAEVEIPPDRQWARIPKIGASLDECEDAVAAHISGATFAVADGASSSFDAATWSRVLVEQFCQQPLREFSSVAFRTWVTLCREIYGSAQSAQSAEAPEGADGWWAAEGARQGAFATLLGARIVKDHGTRCALVIAVGDSCALLFRPEQQRLISSVPLDQAGQFGSHPTLIGSSEGEHIAPAAWSLIPVEPGDVLVLATDAVAEWALGHPDRVAFLARSDIEESAGRLVLERASGAIVNDDLTLLIHRID